MFHLHKVYICISVRTWFLQFACVPQKTKETNKQASFTYKIEKAQLPGLLARVTLFAGVAICHLNVSKFKWGNSRSRDPAVVKILCQRKLFFDHSQPGYLTYLGSPSLFWFAKNSDTTGHKPNGLGNLSIEPASGYQAQLSLSLSLSLNHAVAR